MRINLSDVAEPPQPPFFVPPSKPPFELAERTTKGAAFSINTNTASGAPDPFGNEC